MKWKSSLLIAALCFTVSIIVFPQSSSAEAENSVNAGIKGLVGSRVFANIFVLQYEKMVSDKFSIVGTLGRIAYKYEYDRINYNEIEEGDGPGVEVGFHVYPRRGMSGFYYGANAGIWAIERTWRYAIGSPYFDRKGSDSLTVVDVNFELGGRFRLSENFAIIPTFTAGSLVSSSYAIGGPYVSLGISVGFGF